MNQCWQTLAAANLDTNQVLPRLVRVVPRLDKPVKGFSKPLEQTSHKHDSHLKAI